MSNTHLAPSLEARTASDWYHEAIQAFQDLEVERAFGLVQFAIRLDPNQAEYHLFKAKLFETTGSDRRAAIKAYEAALNLDPRNVETMLRLAKQFQSAGMQIRAEVLIQKAREISPNHKLLKRTDAVSAPTAEEKGKGPDTKVFQDLVQHAKNLFNKLIRRDVDVPCRVPVPR